MGGFGRALAIAALLAVPIPASADWLQDGGDAARTGVISGDLPIWNDVAFIEKIPIENSSIASDPIIVGRVAYVAVYQTWGFVSNDPTAIVAASSTVIYSIDLDTAAVMKVVDPDWPIYYLASDGVRLYGTGVGRVYSWTLDGKDSKQADLHARVGGIESPIDLLNEVQGERLLTARGSFCSAPLLTNGTVYAACHDERFGKRLLAVDAFSTSDLSSTWEQPWIAESNSVPAYSELDCAADPAECNRHILEVGGDPVSAAGANFRLAPRLSVVGANLFVAASTRFVQGNAEPAPSSEGTGWTLYAVGLDGRDGRILLNSFEADTHPPLAGAGGPITKTIPAPTGNDDWVFGKGIYYYRWTPDDVRFGHGNDYNSLGTTDGDRGVGFALRGDVLFTTVRQTLMRMDSTFAADPAFEPVTLAFPETWEGGALALGDSLLAARAVTLDEIGYPRAAAILVVDALTGTLVWRQTVDGLPFFAADDGTVVIPGRDPSFFPTLTVIGKSAAALRPVVSVSSVYPTLQDDVVVDLSGSQAGVGGNPPTLFKADWGDGRRTDWQESPVMSHRYAEAGDAKARFFMSNEAGQTASVPMTIYVDKVNPADNFFNSWYKPSYENTRFFVLGLVVTGIAGLLGILHTGHKRRRMHRELKALEEDYERLKEDAASCDKMLNERKARARSLFLRRKLEEAHASFITTRILELKQGLRFTEVEQRFDFLPQGMVKTLREMLRDAHITEWERTHFLEALDRDHLLTGAQKRQVRSLIDSWFSSDAGRA